jgi:hypothetical protein
MQMEINMNTVSSKAVALVITALVIAAMSACDTIEGTATDSSIMGRVSSTHINDAASATPRAPDWLACPSGEIWPGLSRCTTWTDATYRHIESNQFPNHCVAQDYAFDIEAQPVYDFKIPRVPITSVSFRYLDVCDAPPQRFGIAVHGVVLDPEAIAIWIRPLDCIENDGETGCDGSRVRWQVDAAAIDDATLMCVAGLDMDHHVAHTQEDGKYHYHKLTAQTVSAMTGVVETDLPTRMTLVGWAFDGYPVYWKYGQISKGGPILTMKSQYNTTKGPRVTAWDATMPSLTDR